MRFVGIVLALAFGLATAGPEMHKCPVHDQHAPAAAHHQASSPDHPQDAPQKHCTCPQACCPIGVGVALPAAAAHCSAVETFTAPVAVPAVAILPGTPRYVLPFALAPPRTLA